MLTHGVTFALIFGYNKNHVRYFSWEGNLKENVIANSGSFLARNCYSFNHPSISNNNVIIKLCAHTHILFSAKPESIDITVAGEWGCSCSV